MPIEPPKRRLSARQIEVFRAVMIAGSLSGAARQLNVSQPSLSRLVMRIEDLVGFPLFDRFRGRLRPTAEAETVFGKLQHIQAQFDQLEEAIGQIGRGETGSFRLGASPSLARQLVPVALSRLHQRFPSLPLQMDHIGLAQIVDYLALARGECVLTITPVIDPTVESRAIWPGCLVAIMPRDHRLAGQAMVTPQELVGEKLITCAPGTPHRRMVDEVLAEAGATPRVSVVAQFAESAIGLARAGLGLAVVDEFTAMDAESDRLAVVPLAPVPRFYIHLSWNRGTVRSRFAVIFEAMLVEVLRATAMALPGQAPGRSMP
jgi:DNA-binding transcriptional LysR family regulator